MGLGASRVIYSEYELNQIYTDLDRGYVYALVRTERGVPWDPRPMESWDEYLREFGNTVDDYTDPLVLKSGFLNKAKFIVIRILHCDDITDTTTCTATSSTVEVLDRGGQTLPATLSSGTGPFVITAKSGGQITGTEVGPFTFGNGTADEMLIAVGSGADQPVTLAGTLRTTQLVCDDINAATTGLTATVSAGKVVLTADDDDSSLTVKSVANNCYSVLGITTQVAAASVGTDSLIISIDGDTDQEFTLTPGTRTATQIIADLSALTDATLQSSNGKIIITTELSGSSASIQVQSTSTADIPLGFNDTIVVGLEGIATETLEYTAKDYGEWGDSVRIFHLSSSLDARNRFDVRITYSRQGGMGEYFANLSMDPTDEKYAPTYITGKSSLVDCVTLYSGNPTPLNLPAIDTVGVALEGGADDIESIANSDWIGDQLALTGAYACNKLDMSIDLIVPGTSDHTVVDQIGLMAATSGLMEVYFQVPEYLDPPTAYKWRMGESPYSHVAFNSDAITLQYGRPTVYDTRTNLYTEIPNLGLFASRLSTNDISYGYASAPVGYRRGRVAGVEGLDYNLETMHGYQDMFADCGINYLKISKDKNYAGAVFWEQNTSLLMPYINRKLNVKRFLISFRKIMMPLLKWFIYQKNGPSMWLEVDQTLAPILRRLIDKNDIYAAYLQTDKDAYFASDGTLRNAVINNAIDIAQGVAHIRAFIQPVMAAEIIKFDLGVTNAGVEFANYTILQELPGYISGITEGN